MAFLQGPQQVGKSRPLRALAPAPHLFHFQKQTGAEHPFQSALSLPHEDIDCFAHRAQAIVPLRPLHFPFPNCS